MVDLLYWFIESAILRQARLKIKATEKAPDEDLAEDLYIFSFDF